MNQSMTPILPQLFICGQAMSHCVNHTTRDLIDKWSGENLVLLKDGTTLWC
jgi:nicotinamidase-related amidase